VCKGRKQQHKRARTARGKQTEKKKERERDTGRKTEQDRVQQQAVRVTPDSRTQFAELEKERKQSRGKH
jgi:hypothetical protein